MWLWCGEYSTFGGILTESNRNWNGGEGNPGRAVDASAALCVAEFLAENLIVGTGL